MCRGWGEGRGWGGTLFELHETTSNLARDGSLISSFFECFEGGWDYCFGGRRGCFGGGVACFGGGVTCFGSGVTCFNNTSLILAFSYWILRGNGEATTFLSQISSCGWSSFLLTALFSSYLGAFSMVTTLPWFFF